MALGVPILKHFRVDPILKGFQHSGKHTGRHKSYTLYKSGEKDLSSPIHLILHTKSCGSSLETPHSCRWLAGIKWPFETVFQSESGGLSETRRREKREMADERKKFRTTYSCTSAKTVGPCPTIIKLPSTIPRLPSTIPQPQSPPTNAQPNSITCVFNIDS